MSKNKDSRNQGSSPRSLEGGLMPPQATELEASLLGGILIEPETAYTVMGILQPDDYYRTSHRLVYQAVLALMQKNQPFDMMSVEQYLRESGQLEEVGGPGALGDLTRSVSSAANAEYHAQIVKDKAIRRHLIQGSTADIRDAYENDLDTFDLLERSQQRASDLGSSALRSEGKMLRDLVTGVVSEMRNRQANDGVTGIPSGLKDLDQLTGGWQRSDLIILAARPSMGKTALMLNLAERPARDGIAAGILSMEMSEKKLTQRYVLKESGIPRDVARRGGLRDADLMKLESAQRTLEGLPIVINDQPSISLMEARSMGRRWVREHDIRVLFVDYLQLMKGPPELEKYREQEIAAISRGLKAMAKELNIPVIALSQLSRAVEQRPSKRPQLSDLRESGAIEQDADVVMFLYRPEYYNLDTDEHGRSTKNMAEIIMGKQRDGPTGSVYVHFDDSNGRFTNLTRKQEVMDTVDVWDEDVF